MSSLTFIGALDPFLSMREVTDLLNAAAGGKSSWTADKTRGRLRDLSALVTITGEPESELDGVEPSAPRKRRQLYTTRALLADRARPLYETILKALPEGEFAQHLPST